jgi:tripartite motif-containing protein 71
VLTGFVLLLCVAVALSITTASSAEVSEEGSATGPVPAPSAGAIAEAESEERERDEWLASAPAIAQREASQSAYGALAATGAQELLVSAFPEQLEGLNADPARVLSELEVEEVLGTYGARVALGDAENAIIESTVPVESELGGDGLEPVDLALEQAGDDFIPINPLTEVELPASAGEAIELAGGVQVELPASNEPGAERLGDKNLFYPETNPSTDTLISPIAGGVEVFEQLRAPESPEQFRYALDIPSGADLHLVPGGGAEVISAGGDQIVGIAPPWAVDAQGVEVPVTMSIDGSAVVIEIPHRSREVAYPILLDPRFNNGYESPPFLSSDWVPVTTADYPLSRSGSHLAAVSKGSNFNYPANTWGQWEYSAPGTTAYIENATYSNIYFLPKGCPTPQPHGYAGIYNVSAAAYHSPLGVWANGESYTSNFYVGGGYAGTRKATVGIGTGGASSKLACAHELYVGGVTLQENDPEKPSITTPTGIPTSGWFDPAKVGSATITASDPGFGISLISISNQGGVTSNDHVGCTGMSGSRCPSQRTWTINPPYKEGERSLQVTAEDPTGKVGSWTTTTKVDLTKPKVNLQGQLAEVTKQEGEVEKDQDLGADKLRLATYNLKIEATDIGTEGDANAKKRSGVKDIAVYLDGVKKTVPWGSNPTPCTSCPMNVTYVLDLTEVEGGGIHKLKVIATDQLGHPREREIEFEYFPATGIEDEYVLHQFPLPSGEGNEDEEEHPVRPELAVNVANGNLVYRQEDLDVAGAAADLELERFYNSQLPESEGTEWGRGWTLAQTPALDPNESSTSASILRSSGALESVVELPTSVGEEEFDKRLQATVKKVAGGGYELTDESGETGETVVFSASGKAEELTNGTAATVDYAYEEGDLSEITIEDPGTANVDPASIEEGEPSPALVVSHAANIGGAGTADGQMNAPADAVADAKGNLWVLDRGNSRVQRFGPDGAFVSKFGSAGTAEGQLNLPTAITLDGGGNILLSENARVQKFSPSGQLLLKFGSLGGEENQFFQTRGIAVGADGTIWVADYQGARRFTAAGQFIERVGASGTGQLSSAQSLATAPNGDVYIVDATASRIKVFDKDGDYLRGFGAAGTGPGRFSNATEVDVDDEGHVWVGEESGDRVQVFTEEGDYIATFGAPGSGAQQLAFSEHTGIAVSLGRVWVADAGNHRVSRWLSADISSFLHSANIGSSGSAEGQMSTPADALADEQGNVWVLDRGNSRVQRFGSDGAFISKFGSAGSGEGQLNLPTAIALDHVGNILVTEHGRVQKFSPSGQSLLQFGSLGYGESQFYLTRGITVGADDSLWIADTQGVRRFTPQGQFIERVGASGTGQIYSAQSLATAPNGDVYVVDANASRIKVFDKNGDYLRGFGSAGTGPGQFSTATEVDVDEQGNVWVADEQIDRVQVFTEAGDYIATFGTPGSGAQQLALSEHTGIAVASGRVWVADAGNNRLDEWLGGNYEPSNDPVLTEDDPQLEVDVSDDLVDTVEAEESETIDYEHSGDLLTAVARSRGETAYEYDSEERLTKVELENGTWGQIQYDASNRVKSVTVQPAGGSSKTTHFSYTLEPSRRTVVSAAGDRTVTYDIGEDGSVLKWWNALKAPEIEPLSGSLYAQRGEIHPEPITIGDQTLLVQAHSEEGIASIDIIANGNQLVTEKICAQDYSNGVTECVNEVKEWVTNTESWAPGTLQLEVIVTDSLGQISSERFWVNIPQMPSPGSEAADPPRFAKVLRFREDFGLDLDLKGQELALNERIFDLISAWHNPNTPIGEVARGSAERWGVPMRSVDIAEMEYREWYLQENATRINSWAADNASTTYAGYRVDNRAGGIIYVGFTANPTGAGEALKGSGVPVASERIQADPEPAAHSLKALVALARAIGVEAPPGSTIVDGGMSDYRVEVGALDVGSAQSWIDSRFGPGTPVDIHQTGRWEAASSASPPYWTREGRLYGGQAVGRYKIVDGNPGIGWCSIGLGAEENAGKKPNGIQVVRSFALTAGHCFENGKRVGRWNGHGGVKPSWDDPNPTMIGTAKRRSIESPVEGYATDAELIALDEGFDPPNRVLRGNGLQPLPIGGMTQAVKGMPVCATGARSERPRHGEIQETIFLTIVKEVGPGQYDAYPRVWEPRVQMLTESGDSGGPVWRCGTRQAIGLISARNEHGNQTGIAPLLPPERPEQNEVDQEHHPFTPAQAPGILEAPEIGNIRLTTAD